MDYYDKKRYALLEISRLWVSKDLENYEKQDKIKEINHRIDLKFGFGESFVMKKIEKIEENELRWLKYHQKNEKEVKKQ